MNNLPKVVASAVPEWESKPLLLDQWRREGGHAPRAALQGRHLEGQKYGIMKFCRFWRIGVSIADSNIFYTANTPLTLPQFWDHTP